jgi:phenol/toluene 2-monooxygenase (NADH) P1/A1
LYPLVYRHIDQRLSREHGAALGMLNEFASGWYDETSRWVDATLKTAAIESTQNAVLLGRWIAQWQPRVLEALRPLAVEALGANDAEAALREITQTFDARIQKQGVPLAAQPADQPTQEAQHG